MSDTKLKIPGAETKEAESEYEFLSPQLAAYISSSVRQEIMDANDLPDAPLVDIVEAAVLLADISGFTKLGESLNSQHGDAKGAEEFAKKVSDCISTLVNVVQQYQGEVVKIAGDCLICVFQAVDDDDEVDGDDDDDEEEDDDNNDDKDDKDDDAMMR